jgi:hypothetical protein
MIDPGSLAYADQRMAAADDFLDAMIKIWKEDFAPLGFDESVAVSHLSAFLDGKLTAAGALSDALALAIKRLAS